MTAAKLMAQGRKAERLIKAIQKAANQEVRA
jgi:hypothetical protein